MSSNILGYYYHIAVFTLTLQKKSHLYFLIFSGVLVELVEFCLVKTPLFSGHFGGHKTTD